MLVSSAQLGLLIWHWRPIPGVAWEVAHPIGQGPLSATS
jgi:hypothetical protein